MNNKSIENITKYSELFAKYQNFLTQNQKQVFHLYFFEDLSYGEIANIMATSRSAAFDTLKKAISKLEKIDQQMTN
ncbi:sigma factor-like helix-turn-helix DNA-binding protein [Mycoplasma corogypsi]|uniref:sigma factor-like helix-turn-helix DNA-binding protein n=1 Tax=Mycoplasma corogypsi TaxID=2106 RepID=UPI0038737A86